MIVGETVLLDRPAKILETALAYHDAGLCVVPVWTDGSKALALGKWAHFQQERPIRELVGIWFEDGDRGIGILAGTVSGHLYAWDFDDHNCRLGDTYRAWWEKATKAVDPAVLASLYIGQTPGNGYRVVYRCPEAAVDAHEQLLAAVPTTNGHDALIELFHDGHMFIVPGGHLSTHPSGRPYTTVQGGLTALPILSARDHERLVAAAKEFDQMPKKVKTATRPTTATTTTTASGDRPGDEFAADPATTWESILEPHGWTIDHEAGDATHWTRPGKGIGTSATTGHNGIDQLYVFSASAAPFEAMTGYGKFAAYTLLNHGGDYNSAGKALKARGYGGSRKRAIEAEMRAMAAEAPAPGSPADCIRKASQAAGSVPAKAAHADEAPETKGKKTVATRILTAALERCVPFATPDGTAYIRRIDDKRADCLKVGSGQCRSWLASIADEVDAAPSGQCLADVAIRIEAACRKSGEVRIVYPRLARVGKTLWLDLADVHGRVVKATPEGWAVVERPIEVCFARGGNTASLPVPERGGSWREFRDLLNIADDEWPLIRGWMLDTLKGVGPYTVLLVGGEQGTAKSTLCKALRMALDPVAKASARRLTRDDRDLAVAASKNALLVFDNVSSLPQWLSDALASVATGDGWATRTLYTDDDEKVFGEARPIILNGIPDFATSADLLDRSIRVTCPRIDPTRRRSEDEWEPRFHAALPRLLGLLLDCVVHGLRGLGGVLDRAPRMARTAAWVDACERALPPDDPRFADAYRANRDATERLAVEADPVASTIREWMAATGRPFSGLASELFKALVAFAGPIAFAPAFPKAPNGLMGHLRRVTPSLQAFGLEVVTRRTKRGAVVTIKSTGPRGDDLSGKDRHSEGEDRHHRHPKTISEAGESPRGDDHDRHRGKDRHRDRHPLKGIKELYAMGLCGEAIPPGDDGDDLLAYLGQVKEERGQRGREEGCPKVGQGSSPSSPNANDTTLPHSDRRGRRDDLVVGVWDKQGRSQYRED